jgi:hypothetical protein
MPKRVGATRGGEKKWREHEGDVEGDARECRTSLFGISQGEKTHAVLRQQASRTLRSGGRRQHPVP